MPPNRRSRFYVEELTERLRIADSLSTATRTGAPQPQSACVVDSRRGRPLAILPSGPARRFEHLHPLVLFKRPKMAADLRDLDIRPALRRLLQESDPSDGVVIEELGLNKGAVRVDLAVINGLMHAYEIKSDFDTLRRLSAQVEYYGKCFDRVSLVVGPRHIQVARKSVPKWWGIVRVTAGDDGPRFAVVRIARPNPARDARSLIQLLWREATLALLESIGAAEGVRSKARDVLWDRAIERLSLEDIARAVRDHLKANAGRLGLSAP